MKTIKVKINSISISALLFLAVGHFSFAANPPAGTIPGTPNPNSTYSSNGVNVNPGCDVGKISSYKELDINNVRARYLNAGDMFWDAATSNSQARYEVPKVTDNSSTRKHSMFAAAIWLGGQERGTDNILVMVQTYRQNGLRNYWPGPIQYANKDLPVPTNKNICSAWDQLFKCNRRTVKEFVDNKNFNSIPDEIKFWPGKGNPYLKQKSEFAADPGAIESINSNLANFYDNDSNGVYNPAKGDYPLWAGTEKDTECPGTEKNINAGADQVIWWVCNDAGNIKNFASNTKDIPAIGMEIHYEAFAYASTDATNDMTFLRQRLYNRGSYILDQTYLAQWADPDLGNAGDDYVGCDVMRGLGICYNGDDNDEGSNGYGLNPPAIGVDFFRGPFPTEKLDDIDWDLDCRGPGSTPPDTNERIIMSGFIYYNNSDHPVNGEPNKFSDYYNYIRNKWRNGNDISFGGQGTDPVGPGKVKAQYMFPNVTNGSDPFGYACGNTGCIEQSCGSAWNENTANNAPGDRRFLANNGPFTLKPGAFNECTIGIVWARATSGGATGSFGKLLAADDKAQDRFNECFKRNIGPNSPNLEIVEDHESLVFNIIPDTIVKFPLMTTETYVEQNRKVNSGNDLFYRFQGYKLYQLADDKVSVQDLNNPDRARFIKGDFNGDGNDDFNGIMDVQDGISNISSLEYNPDFDLEVLTPKVRNAPDKGIYRSFKVTKDAFGTSGLGAMADFKKYYYAVVAYGFHNNSAAKEPYIQGVANYKIYTAIPHKPAPEAFGTTVSTAFGGGFEITRINGTGNSGNNLEFTDGIESEVLKNNSLNEVAYRAGDGPIDVKIYNPKALKGGKFEMKLTSRLTYKKSRSNHEFQVGDTICADSVLQFDSTYRVSLKKMVAYQLNQRIGFKPGKAVITRIIPDRQNGDVINLDIDLLGYNGFKGTGGAGTFGFVNDDFELDKKTGDFSFNDSKKKSCSFYLKSDPQKRSPSEDFEAYDYWKLTTISEGQTPETIYSEKPITEVSEQLIAEYGISVRLKKGITPGSSPTSLITLNGTLPSRIEYGPDPFKQYLVPISSDYFPWFRTDKFAHGNNYYSLDPRNAFLSFAGGAWVPYVLSESALAAAGGPQFVAKGTIVNAIFTADQPNSLQAMTRSSNVDVVFTQDKSKWTRCVVLQNDTLGGDTKARDWYTMSKSRKLSKNLDNQLSNELSPFQGLPSKGVSWFPGYAIDLDKGVRLNMMFSESSALALINSDGASDSLGNDLIWSPRILFSNNGTPRLQDKCYIFVMNSVYDQGKAAEYALDSMYTSFQNLSTPNFTSMVRNWYLENMMYVGMMGQFRDPAKIPDVEDVRVKLRVERNFQSFGLATNPSNMDLNPKYQFKIPEPGTLRNQTEVAKNALDMIRVVPNPYISVSGYENSQIDNRVKIVNLPTQCVISIFNLAGSLIRQYNYDQTSTLPYATIANGEYKYNARGSNYQTWLDWDLKNQDGIPIASGVYLIHIKSDKLGERTLKWFGVLRPIDLDTFN